LIRLDHYISLTSPKHVDPAVCTTRSSSLNLSKRRTAEVFWPPPARTRTNEGSHPQEGRPARTPPPTFLFLPDSQLQTAGLAPRPPGLRRTVETPRFQPAPEPSDQWSFRGAIPARQPAEATACREGGYRSLPIFLSTVCNKIGAGLPPTGYVVMIPPL